MLESVEKLRKTADDCTQIAGVEDKFETVWITKSAFMQMLDAVEEEVEQNYVELPKDADGVTIHVGDVLCAAIDDDLWSEKVSYLCLQDDGWRIGNIGFVGDAMTHHKPPTVEDVLREFLADAEDAVRKGYDDVPKEVYAEYAERLQLKEDE